MEVVAASSKVKLLGLIRLIRVHQWVKNLFIFIPAFFGGAIYDVALLYKLVMGFFAFSCFAGSVYIINDYVDIEKDRMHPEKCKRPLASGVVSKRLALTFLGLTLSTAIALSWFTAPEMLMITGAYFIMNLGYSFGLKNMPILDISIIALGFIFRVISGGIITNIEISKWLILLTFLLAMLLALAKRRDEYLIYMKGTQTRKSLTGYNLQFIDMCMIMMATITVVSYIMYTVSVEVITRIGSDKIYLTTLFVILGIMRYLQLAIVLEKSGAPSQTLMQDRFIQLVLLAWGTSFFVLIYI